jgi:outer membrane scaffolding protein for murein synthesis (MipA/OmpV family)
MNHITKLNTVAAISLSVLCFSALAETPATAPTENSLVVGAGLQYAPEYAGGNNYKTSFLPTFSYRNRNGFFADSKDGVGYTVWQDKFSLSASLDYRAGRTDDFRSFSLKNGSADLKGLGDIRNAVTTRLKGVYTFDGGVSVSATGDFAVNHRETGDTLRLGVAAPLFTSKSDQVTLDAGALYGDSKYTRSNFGVTSAQSVASGYRAFNPKAGFENVSASVAWNHVLDKNWSIKNTLGVNHLVGDAADSPLARKKTSGTFSTSLNYSF